MSILLQNFDLDGFAFPQNPDSDLYFGVDDFLFVIGPLVSIPCYFQITQLVTPTGLPLIKDVNFVLLQAESDVIRWRDDGTDPTATVGNRLVTSKKPTLYQGDYQAIRFIGESAAAILNVRFG